MSNYALKLTNITKKYDDFLLDNVSFNVPKGNIVGLIGENGSGKSTTLNSILDIIERDFGDVFILDSEKNKISNDIREKIGVVFDGNNFPENLTPQKLNNVLKAIYNNWEEKRFYELLEKFSLPKNKKIKKFSKGMKMKLSISVALSHKAQLLILDEATSNVDTRTEELVQQAMDKLTKGRTSFIIAHRLSTIKNADIILVMKEGNIIEQGSHDELIKKKGFYADLYNSQFEN